MITRKVKRVLTPSLIELESGDKVRLISVDDTKQVTFDETKEDFDPEVHVSSSDFLASMVVGKSVRLVFDKKMLDPDGNLLAYVEIKTGPEVWMTVNKRIIGAGYAGFREDPFNKARAGSLEFMNQIAQDKKVGIWKE